MENQTKREVERALLLKLRGTVNYKEEYDWVLAELAALDAEERAADSSNSINTVADAALFLEQRCDYRVVQLQIDPPLWEVDGRYDMFSGTYTETEVIQLARGEQALRQTRSEAARSDSVACPQVQPSRESRPINCVADAVGFLAECCDLLAVQLEIVPPLWNVVSLDGEFEALFSDVELMDFARDERDVRFVLTQDTVGGGSSCQDAEHGRQARPIDTTEDAVSFLHALDVEIIETDGGLILRGVGLDGAEFELTCDSDADLIEYARSEREMCLMMCSELGVDSPGDIRKLRLFSSVIDATAVESESSSGASSSWDENAKEEVKK